MSLKNWIHPPTPCKKCPYKRGLIQMPGNPCAACRENGFLTFAQLRRKLEEERSTKGASKKPNGKN